MDYVCNRCLSEFSFRIATHSYQESIVCANLQSRANFSFFLISFLKAMTGRHHAWAGMSWLVMKVHDNRPRSLYQYSSMAPRLSGQNCKIFKFPLSLNSQKRLRYKENNTKYSGLTWKPRSHVRILIYRTWPIGQCHMQNAWQGTIGKIQNIVSLPR